MLSAARCPSPLRLAQRGIVLVLCLALGLHWALLQGIAWTGMLLSFASEGSVIEAVEKTFDGQHPCELCKKVKEGAQDSEDGRQSAPQDDAAKGGLHAVLVSTATLLPPAGELLSFAPLCEVLISRKGMPEPPPPRSGQV